MFVLRMATTISILLLLGGCASISKDDLPYLLPVGSDITLTQAIETSNGAHINIQGGRVAVRGELEVVYPYCLFEVYRPAEDMATPLIIEEDTFTVEKAFQQLNYINAKPSQQLQNIAAYGVQFAGFDANRSLSTVMEISSDRQPAVNHFVCVKWGNPTRDGYVSLNDMRTALGSLVTLSPRH